jgi:kynureninase
VIEDRAQAEAMDAADGLAPLRGQFDLTAADAEGVIYLDGNSLGALPASASTRLRDVVEREWGRGLIRSWNTAGWITAAARIAGKIAPLIGAASDEVMVADSTSANLFKALSAAVDIAAARSGGFPAASGRRRIVSERTNFPTDLYIAETLARAHGLELVLIEADDLAANLDERLAVLMLTHVNYRTGRMHRMAEVTRAAHAVGALVIWDLAHSAGAMPVDVHGGGTDADAADFAVGCGYKYLNGGPGAPAFVWVHPRHLAWMDRRGWRQPLSGWLGHAAPFAFTPDYQPATGIDRFICGTPPVLSLAALECGVDTVRAADAYGGLEAVRRKSLALTEQFAGLVETRCAGHDLTLVTPRAPEDRGSQVSFAHATGGYPMMQALIARGVIGDFRAPDILRFGFTPLYTRFVDVWDAVDRFREVLETGEWRNPRFAVRAAVT